MLFRSVCINTVISAIWGNKKRHTLCTVFYSQRSQETRADVTEFPTQYVALLYMWKFLPVKFLWLIVLLKQGK